MNDADRTQRLSATGASRRLRQGTAARRGLGLQPKLILAFLLVALVPLLLSAYMHHQAEQEALTRAAHQALLTAASRSSLKLDSFIRHNEAVLGNEAHLPDLADHLALPPELAADPSRREHICDILGSFSRRDRTSISSYGLADLAGTMAADTDPSEIGQNIGDRDYFQASIQTGLPYSSQVIFRHQDGRSYIIFSAPVQDRAGRTVGVLRARYSAAVLQDMVAQDSGLAGPQSFPLLLDDTGLILAYGAAPHLNGAGLLHAYVRPPAPGLRNRLQASRRLPPRDDVGVMPLGPSFQHDLPDQESPRSSFTTTLAPFGERSMAGAVAKLATRPWRVVFLQPHDAFLVPVEQQTRRTMILTLTIGLLAAGAAAALARLLTDPVTRLTAVARKVAEGDLDAVAQVDSGDEVGTLAATFNLMTLRLQDTLRGMEQRMADLRRSEEAQRRSEEKFRSIFENAVEGIFQTDLDGQIFSANSSLARILGYASPDELMEQVSDSKALHADARELKELKGTLDTAEAVSGRELRLYRKDGRVIWVSMNIRLVRDTDGVELFHEGSVEDISARKKAEEMLHFQAYHDSLTGLPNRSRLLENLGKALERSRRRKGYSYALIFLDLDRFKHVNDSLGHLAGDSLLIRAAELLQESVRQLDTVARLGGDEFVILLEEIASARDAIRAVKRIKQNLGRPFDIDGHEVFVTASLGIVLGPVDHQGPEDILRYANIAMHHAKEKGKDRFLMFRPSMLESARRILRFETDLRRACQNREFVLHYQPIYSLRSGRMARIEALVRWNHPEHGLIPPGEFIPLAEETGLIVPLGELVLREACRQLAVWREMFGQTGLRMSVNISGRQFARQDLPDRIDRIIKESGLPPDRLELEITESVVMGAAETSTSLLGRLKRLGVGLSIDDFGTGYSSLSYLQRFPVDTIKIDRCFVGSMDEDPGNREIVRAIISLSHSLGKEVVAEGVESPDQLALLREFRCGLGQGYALARPMVAAALEDLLAQGARLEEML